MLNLVVCAAALQSLPPISTDRPDFTEGARAVSVGSTQLETGVSYLRWDGLKVLTLPEALVRHGVSEGLEARIGLPNFVSFDAGAKVDGIANPSLGFKLDLNESGQTEFALIGQVTFATGDRDVRIDRDTPGVALAWSRDLKDASVGGMLLAEFPGGPALFRHTFVYSKPVSNDTSLFAEHVLDFSETMNPSHLAHFGLAKAVGNDAQFDVHVGFGLNRNSPDFLIGAGYSVRF